MLFSEAIFLYKKHMTASDKAQETIKGYMIELNLLSRYLMEKYNSPVYLEEITMEDLDGYIERLKQLGKAAVSRSRTIYIMRAFYNFCVKKGYLVNNLGMKLEPIPVPEKERIYLKEPEVKALIKAVESPMIRLIVSTLYYTGMRISECLNLKIEDVRLNDAIISVKNTKSKRDRQIPIHNELELLLRDYFENWRNGDTSSYFFCINKKKRVSPDHVNRDLHKATRKLGWNKHVTCHIIRHSFASNLVARNVNIVSIQKLLGHSDLSTTSIYTHTNLDELKKAVNAI